MGRYSWSRQTHLQIGRFGEYYAKMEFALYGFEIYTSEVDDRGIDFVARHGAGPFYEVQVKSIRGNSYVCMRKSVFPLREDRLLTLVRLLENEPPELYLIPATTWLKPNALFVDRKYQGLKSAPEWGLVLSQKASPLLRQYEFGAVVQMLMVTRRPRTGPR